MRLITKTRQVDHIKITTLQNLTAIPSIEDRSIELMHKYLNQATTHNSPIRTTTCLSHSYQQQ
eukprot:Pgem_evm1s2055